MSVARNIHQPEMSIMILILMHTAMYKNDHLLLIWKSDSSVGKMKKNEKFNSTAEFVDKTQVL